MSHFPKYYRECPVCFSTWGRPHYSKEGICEHWNYYADGRRRCYGSDIQWTTWEPYREDSYDRNKVWTKVQELRAPNEHCPRFPCQTQPVAGE